MAEYRIFQLTGTSPRGTHSLKIRALNAAQAQGIADATVASDHGTYVQTWTVEEHRTACFSHEGCDGADDTHEALKNLDK
jgi:hypothetical protein